ncbi:hypothetical protein [Actinobacillus capsulatus]|uniref:hypothetical protein n=1 Tax=Actinobacillus capsulatus TaxID=717 RepID=UPI00037BD823|nr:hypothetical protein [Actinobacillus capsulatus]
MVSEDVLNRIVIALREYRETAEKDHKNFKRWEFCLSTLAKMEREFSELKKITPYSVLMQGEELDKYLNDRPISDELYLICAWFVREMHLYSKRNNIERIDLENLWYDFRTNKDELNSAENQFRKDYIIRGLDIDILNFNLKYRDYEEFENYKKHKNDAIKEIKKLKEEIALERVDTSNFLNEAEDKTEILAKKLDEQKTAFNFVGLSKGFENLLSQKRWSKWTSFGIMSVFCVLLVALPIVIIGGRFFNWFAEYNIEWSKIGWEQMLPILGLELVFIYFFRVALHYNSIQTQIMQLELRQSLCQFIQSYADYAKEIKEKDGASLEKFENLIFSSILSDSEKVPSTFDGLEQLSNLIKEFKK